MPVRKGGWWYYSRTEEGAQYPIHCRKAARSHDGHAPAEEEVEQVMLDQNVEAGDGEFFAVGAFDTTPDAGVLAWSSDLEGDEVYTMRFRDLATGDDLDDVIEGTYYGTAWGPTAPPSSTSAPTRPCAPTSSGATSWAHRPTTTSWCTPRTTSASSSVWAPPRTSASSCSAWRARSPARCGSSRPTIPRASSGWSSPAARTSSTASSTTTAASSSSPTPTGPRTSSWCRRRWPRRAPTTGARSSGPATTSS